MPRHAAAMRLVAGSSLIESLTALAVFAVGAACHGVWTMRSMATHARASRLVAATTIAVSLEVRMRANREGVLAGDYAEDNVVGGRCWTACAPRALAAHDLGAFRAAVARHLGPAATGRVACVDGGGCAIVIGWAGREVVRWEFAP